MKFERIFLYFSLFFFNVDGLKILSKSELGGLTIKARELVENCFAEDFKLVITTSELADAFQNSDKVSTIVIESKFDNQKQGIVTSYPILVLPYESTQQIQKSIQMLEKTNYWSTTSPFLVIETSSNCLNAKILGSLMEQNYLSAFYLCNDKNSSIIKTLNPFTAYAPYPWIQSSEKFQGENEKKWTIFSLNYSKDREICSALTYDKTKLLDGAKVLVMAHADPKEMKNETFAQSHLKKKLNVKEMNVYQIVEEIGGEPTIAKISSNITPEVLARFYPVDPTISKVHEFISTFNETEYSILTKKTSFLSSTKTITVNFKIISLTICALVMILLLLILTRDQLADGPFLNFIRLIFGFGMKAEFNRLSMKIIFFIAFVFSFFLTSDFLGEIQTSLVSPTQLNAETLQDLFDDKFKVYYHLRVHQKIYDTNLWNSSESRKKYLTRIGNPKHMHQCSELAKTNPKIACIDVTLNLLKFAKENDDVYVSKKPVFKVLHGLMYKKDGVLKEKFSKKAAAAYESGQFFRFDDQERREIKKNLKKIERMEKIKAGGDINNEYFVYFFGYFMIIMLFAFAVFMIERQLS